MVLTLTFVVVAVSSILLYFTTRMIIEDKRAYLFDSAYQSLDSGSATLEQFIKNKQNFAAALGSLESIDKDRLPNDDDLYELSYLVYLEDNQTPEGIYTFYKNSSYLDRYKKKENFLELPESFIVNQSQRARTEGISAALFNKKGKAPRLVIFNYDEKGRRVLCFDYLLDNIFNSNFSKQSFEMTLVNSKGELLFHNRPYTLTPSHNSFFESFIKERLNGTKTGAKTGVKEVKISDMDYILGFKQLSLFPDHFLISTVKTAEAYEVTSILLINTLVYTLSLIAIFNIISVFIARSITNPLDKLTEIIKNISGGNYNVRVTSQSTTELQSVADSFNEMVDKIQDYQAKLIEYNKTLEQKVEERTENLKRANNFIKTMVDSLGQGLLVFDRNGICMDLHTKACVKLIGVAPGGKSLGKLIHSPDQELLKDWIMNLFEEMIPFESLVELGQKFIPCNEHHSSPSFKHITLEFFPMRDDEEKVQNVVMVASDKTREYKAFKEVEAQQNYVKLVSKVLKDKISFMRFVNSFEESLISEKIKITAEESVNKEDFMRLLHSMKGSAAFYSLQELVSFLHHFESEVGSDSLKTLEIVIKIEQLLELLKISIKGLKEVIGDTTIPVVEVQEEKLRSFWKSLAEADQQMAYRFSSEFLEIEVEQYVLQYKELVNELAVRLGKKIKPLVIDNGYLKVDMNYYREFFDSCIHLFRNAVDHAIEEPEVRLNSGKPEEGSLSMTFNIVNAGQYSFLEFNVVDDGRGIDPQRIRKKLVELNYSPEILQKSDSQIIYHIFDPYFSTAEQVSDLSGRGVGLFDIKKNIEKLNGTIELQSRVGKGTIFSFLIPLPISSVAVEIS